MVIAVTNWTAILVGALTGATGVAAAWFGYLGSRLASRTALEQSQTETAREREERLARERDGRRVLYAAFLDVERGLVPALRAHQFATQGPDSGVEERAALEDRFYSISNALNGLVLGAPQDVASGALLLHQLLSKVITEERQRPRRTTKIHNAVIRDLVSQWTPARRALVDAMRADVAPDATPLEWPRREMEEVSAAAVDDGDEPERKLGDGDAGEPDEGET